MESINNRFAIVNEGISNNTANITKNTTSITNLNNRVTNLKAYIGNFNVYEKELFFNKDKGVDAIFKFTITPKNPGHEIAISEDMSNRYNYFDNFSVISRKYGPYGDIEYWISCKANNTSSSSFYFKVMVLTISTILGTQ